MCPGKYIKREMSRIHDFIPVVPDYAVVLSLICLNWTQNGLMHSWKNVHVDINVVILK